MKFTFNTGRHYTRDGQVINVEMTPARIYFYDESRGIAGSVPNMPMYPGEFDTQRHVQAAVMSFYDYCKYKTESIPAKGQARRIES